MGLHKDSLGQVGLTGLHRDWYHSTKIHWDKGAPPVDKQRNENYRPFQYSSGGIKAKSALIDRAKSIYQDEDYAKVADQLKGLQRELSNDCLGPCYQYEELRFFSYFVV